MQRLISPAFWFAKKEITQYEAAYLLCDLEPPLAVESYPSQMLQDAEDWALENLEHYYAPNVPGFLSTAVLIDPAELRERVTKEWPLYARLKAQRSVTRKRTIQDAHSAAIEACLKDLDIPKRDWRRLKKHEFSQATFWKLVREKFPSAFKSEAAFNSYVKKSGIVRFQR